jgi:tetratricopeptide (TPR) repeat protein
MGRGNFTGGNHYCYGLIRIHRCNKVYDKAKQASCFKRPIKEMDYTLEHTSKNFPYRAMAYFHRGDLYLRLNDTFKAEQDLLQAISIKPNYTRAYGKLFDIYFERGDLELAREILDKGLKHKPNSRSLKRRLKKLD